MIGSIDWKAMCADRDKAAIWYEDRIMDLEVANQMLVETIKLLKRAYAHSENCNFTADPSPACKCGHIQLRAALAFAAELNNQERSRRSGGLKCAEGA